MCVCECVCAMPHFQLFTATIPALMWVTNWAMLPPPSPAGAADAPRVVLIVDVWHPDLSPQEVMPPRSEHRPWSLGRGNPLGALPPLPLPFPPPPPHTPILGGWVTQP